MCKIASVLAATAILATTALAAPPAAQDWREFMPAEVIGARSFVRVRPHLDGRGLVVAVLDTGVDPLATGLTRTSTGAPKVIEARDFTGQGDVVLQLAGISGDADFPVARTADVVLRGLESVTPTAFDGQWWLGTFDEKQIGPPDLRDWNRNGRGDDKLALLVWRTGPGPDDVRALIDLDGNGMAHGEPVVRPFHVAQELFVPKVADPDSHTAQLSLAFEPDFARSKASLHFTDGSHGTHVAGIIAGWQVFGRQGWDGIAPGAQVLSLKIGHNARSGGATPTESFLRAVQFAADWSRRTGRPVVLNASYGVGAGAERNGDIDKAVDDAVRGAPLLTVSFSAGNDGPGISSVGSPAAADLALAVGAMLPRETVPTLYGGKTVQHELFAFSSRGGELTKPEVVAPGVAATSVPIWDGREVKNGTSMASPQVAGAMLLVWAALLDATDKAALADPTKRALPGLHSGLVRRALTWSARPLPGYSLLDQGHGLVDVGRAAALAARLWQRSGESKSALGYRLETSAPRHDGVLPPANYWRTGVFVPGPDWNVKTEVRALLPTAMPAAEREKFSTVLDLSVDADWVELVRPRVHLRADRPATFEVRLRPDKLRAPGLYTAKVVGREAGSQFDEAAFECWQVVVVPLRPDPAAGAVARWPDVKVQPGQVWRQWVMVPPGSRQLRLNATRKPGVYSEAYVAVFDPDGRRVRPDKRFVSSQEGLDAEWLASGSALQPGVWEITLAGGLQATQATTADIEVAFTGLRGAAIDKLAAASGSLPEAKTTLTNLWGEPFVGSAKGAITHAGKADKATVKDDTHTFKVALGPLYRGARLKLALARETYDQCTDVAVTVKDASGREVFEGAFHGPEFDASWRKASGKTDEMYTVAVAAGFAFPRKEPWKLDVDQALELAQPLPLDVKAPAGPGGQTGQVWAFANVPVKLDVKATQPLPQAPDGFQWRGAVDLWTLDGTRRWASIPIGDD
jgi:subtilisin family serine protease